LVIKKENNKKTMSEDAGCYYDNQEVETTKKEEKKEPWIFLFKKEDVNVKPQQHTSGKMSRRHIEEKKKLRNEHESQTTTLLPSLEQLIPAVVKSKCPAPLDIHSSRKSFRTPHVPWKEARIFRYYSFNFEDISTRSLRD
ncbi:8369_t:CDS:2, partial [Gigaspora margarita]